MFKLPSPTTKTPKKKRIKLDRLALAKKWRKELVDGKYSNAAELARCWCFSGFELSGTGVVEMNPIFLIQDFLVFILRF